jgi:hypothetical protein
MKISVLTSFYNGDPMIPYFLNHYSYADEIIALFNDHGIPVDAPTGKLIMSYPNVRIESFEYPQRKTDYAHAVAVLNQAVAKLECDWAIIGSADELAFPVGMGDVREVLRGASGSIIPARLWWVYRHRTDKDLDPSLPAIWQRRHGSPDRTFFGCLKPMIVRPSAGITYSIGGHNCHAARGGVSTTWFDGAHWLNADPEMAVKRRMRGRREMVSQRTLHDGMGSQFFDITERAIRAECAQFLDAPQVF